MAAVRSLLFLLILLLVTPPYTVGVILCRPLPHHMRRRSVVPWVKLAIWLVKHVLGIPYRLLGAENIPARAAVVLAKHQSAWETLFLEATFPYQCWIIKRELVWLPFVGWGLVAVRSIAIDRSSGVAAREQIVQQGAKRLAEGLWVTIFPEGTRVAVGKRGRYGIGGATLATRTGTPVLPIAHNAGEFWGRYAFRKHAGTVRVVIGPVIETKGRDALEVTREVENWIEGQMRRLNPERYAGA